MPGFSAEEVAAAKTGCLKSLRVQHSRDETLAQVLQSLLREGLTMIWLREFEKRVEAVTAHQVQDVVRKYLLPSQLSIFAAGDFKNVGISQ